MYNIYIDFGENMKYLILFELGKKRFVQSFVTKNSAIKAINDYTKLSDDVIDSISKLEKDKYELVFEGGDRAIFRIVRSKDENVLGYYPADLGRIFAKLRSILLQRREKMAIENKKIKNEKLKNRLEALVMVMAGLAIIMGGFSLTSMAFAFESQAWRYASMGALIALGIASTIRGVYFVVKPSPKEPKHIVVPATR